MSRVLLVENDVDSLELRKLILENQGHTVFAARNVSDAREQFHAAHPESVILDLRLPKPEDGLALIREFRAASDALKIVVLSGWCADLAGREEGSLVNVTLSKPVRSEVLLNAIRLIA